MGNCGNGASWPCMEKISFTVPSVSRGAMASNSLSYGAPRGAASCQLRKEARARNWITRSYWGAVFAGAGQLGLKHRNVTWIAVVQHRGVGQCQGRWLETSSLRRILFQPWVAPTSVAGRLEISVSWDSLVRSIVAAVRAEAGVWNGPMLAPGLLPAPWLRAWEQRPWLETGSACVLSRSACVVAGGLKRVQPTKWAPRLAYCPSVGSKWCRGTSAGEERHRQRSRALCGGQGEAAWNRQDRKRLVSSIKLQWAGWREMTSSSCSAPNGLLETRGSAVDFMDYGGCGGPRQDRWLGPTGAGGCLGGCGSTGLKQEGNKRSVQCLDWLPRRVLGPVAWNLLMSEYAVEWHKLRRPGQGRWFETMRASAIRALGQHCVVLEGAGGLKPTLGRILWIYCGVRRPGRGQWLETRRWCLRPSRHQGSPGLGELRLETSPKTRGGWKWQSVC